MTYTEQDRESLDMGHTLRRFYFEKKRGDRNKARYRTPRSLEPAWLRAGAICLNCGADPQDFVSAIFMKSRSRGGPFPNTFGSATALRMYKEYEEEFTIETEEVSEDGIKKVRLSPAETRVWTGLQQAMDVVWNIHQSAVITHEIVESTLRDLTLFSDPLIVALLAPHDPHIQRNAGQKARQDLSANPMLVEACKKNGLPVEAVMEWSEVRDDK
jgi:hypothetical protein